VSPAATGQVQLTSSIETQVCPGETVEFTCTVYNGASLQWDIPTYCSVTFLPSHPAGRVVNWGGVIANLKHILRTVCNCGITLKCFVKGSHYQSICPVSGMSVLPYHCYCGSVYTLIPPHPHPPTPSFPHTLIPTHPHPHTPSSPHTLILTHPHPHTPSSPHTLSPHSSLHTLIRTHPHPHTHSSPHTLILIHPQNAI